MSNQTLEEIRLPNPPRFLRLLRWRVVIPLLLVLAAVMPPLFIRTRYLALMPRTEEPFAAEALLSLEIPDADNAFTHYRAAEALAVAPSDAVSATRTAVLKGGWERATPDLEKYLQASEPSRAEYRRGTRLDQALYLPVGESRYWTPIPVLQGLDLYTVDELLLALRHEARGEYREAWELLRNAIRASRHAGQNGGDFEREFGIIMMSRVLDHLEIWAAGESLTADDLLQARRDLELDWTLTVAMSQVLKVEYLSELNTLNDLENERPGADWSHIRHPDCESVFRRYLRGEPELGRRIVRFYCRNQLLFADLAYHARPPVDLASGLFDAPSGLSANGHSLTPSKCEQAVKESPVAITLDPSSLKVLALSDREAARFQIARALLAAQAYYRDHGQFPADRKELVPDYLPEIPVDPYDGKPLKYRADPAEPVIYSVYLNQLHDEELAGLGFRLLTPNRPPLIAPRPDVP